MPQTLKLTDSERLTVRRHDPDVLEVEAEYGPAGKPPPSHLHPAQDEHFEVLAGELRARVAGEERRLRAGDTLDIPRGTSHQTWNGSDEPARVLWQTKPAGRTLEWFEAIDGLHREGRTRGNGMPGPRTMAVLLTEYRDVFRLAARPAPVVRGGLALLAAIGRATGAGPRSA